MDERLRESLSALMDDEANELEVERVLSRIGDDSELRQTWVRYNAARSLASGQSVADLSVDISGQVSRAIAQEPAVAASLRGRFGHLLRPVASFAVAASVAAVVVVGGQQLSEVGTAAGGQDVRVSPPGLTHTIGARSVPASYGIQPLPGLEPAVSDAYRKLARQRMKRYMQEHAEHAALNTPQGLIPFARVPEIRE